MGKEDKNKESLSSVLAIIMKSGKVNLGYKSTINSMRNGKAKVVILSNNLPVIRRSQIEYYAFLLGVNVLIFNGNNSDLGSACGKLFRIGSLAVLSEGDSELSKDIKAKKFV